MVHKTTNQIVLILLFLFLVFPLITLAIQLDSSSPRYTSNSNQALTINGSGLNGGPPRWIYIVDTAGTPIGSASATADPFSILINPSAGLSTGTTEFILVDCAVGQAPPNGDSSTQKSSVYHNNVPATITTINVNPGTQAQGGAIAINIDMDQAMQRTGLVITITDSGGGIHNVNLGSITFNNGSVAENTWSSLTVNWVVPLSAGVGVANISIIANTATNVATVLTNAATFNISTSVAGVLQIIRPAAAPAVGGGGETINSGYAQFQWTNVTNAASTYIEFWSDVGIGSTNAPTPTSTPPLFSIEASSNPFPLSFPLYNGTSYWYRVVVVDAGGGTTMSNLSSRLTIDQRPTKILTPEAKSPGNVVHWPPSRNVMAERAPRDPIWGHVDPAYPGTEDRTYQPWTYIFDMSLDPTFTSGNICVIDPIPGQLADQIFVTPKNIEDQLAAEGIDPSTIAEGTWYIRIRARDAVWTSGYAHIGSTAVRRIEIDNTPDAPPILMAPPDGDPSYFTSETQPLFIWSKVLGAEKFALEFASDAEFTTFFSNHCMTLDVGISFTSETFRPSTPLPVNTQIYWRVKTIDKAGNATAIPATGPGIPYRRLYIDTVPPDGSYVQLTSPENFSLSSDYTPTFTWNWENDPAATPPGQAPLDSPADGIEMDKAILEYHTGSTPWPDVSTVGSASSGRFTVESNRTSNPNWDSQNPGRLNSFTYTSTISFTPNTIYYWRVRPVDSAGNIGASSTIFRFDYGLSSNQLPAPIIKDPANGEIVTSQTITVKVQTFPPALIPGQPVRTYSVKVYAVVHDMNTLVANDIKLLAGPQSVPPGEDTATLSVTLGSGDGLYTLIATVVDSAGSESNPANSLPVRIILDRGHPKVSHLTITSNHEGSTSAPADDVSSKLIVQIVYSEPMMQKDTSNNQLHPDVYIYPEKGINSIKAEPMESPKKSWSEAGNTWTGIASIPAGKGYDGQASVSIGGTVTDLAGRRISPNPTYYPDYFVINTAPLLEVKAFYNPTDQRDIIVSIESSEKLRMVPLVEIDFNGEVSTITTNLVHDLIYTGVFTIPANRSGQVNIVAYGTDYAGNTGLDKYAFRVIEVDPYEGYNVTYPKDFYLKIVPETLEEKKSIVIIPRQLDMAEISAKTSSIYKIENSPELVPIKEVSYDIGPYSLEFKKPISIEFDISEVDSATKMGIFNYRLGKWNYVPSFRIGDTIVGASYHTGIYAVMADIKEPRIINVTPDEGENMTTTLNQIEIEFLEDGSGLDISNIDFRIDDVRKSVHVEDSKIVFRPYLPLKSGEHEITLSISDNLGNVSQQLKQKFYAPKAFEVYDFYFYPNPSDTTDPIIHYILTQNSTDVRIKIYDLSDQLVTTIDNLPTTIGEHKSVTWDRKNDDLDSVANGVYYAKITAKDSSNNISEKIIKIVVLR